MKLSKQQMLKIKAGVKGKGRLPADIGKSCSCTITALDVETGRCMACNRNFLG